MLAALGGEAQIPDLLQNPPKSRFRREAHSSIRIQEGEPNLTFGQIAPSIAHCLRRDDGGFCQQIKWFAEGGDDFAVLPIAVR